MAIFRCNKCDHLREVGGNYLGKRVKCPECKNITQVFDTVTYVSALLSKYKEQKNALELLQSDSAKNGAVIRQDRRDEGAIFDNIDLHNTNVLVQEKNLEPIAEWFKKHGIETVFNPEAADTAGFFDEIALKLGDDFDALSYVTNQIKYVQAKGYKNVKLDVSSKTPEEVQRINSFCEDLYEYSFVAKHIYQKKDKVIRLVLQTAPRIRGFFNGLWMEWFTLIKLLYLFKETKIAPACTRSLNISFNDGKSNELDIFVLSSTGIAVCIECKSGEFRHDIDKYLALRKRLGISKSQFVICVFGLSDEQSVGMTSMYDLTFVNHSSVIDHVADVLRQPQ
ncbi:MAG: phage FluMu protein Com [Cryomorphaceae bacterium]|jgi:phage FluMu protein Com